MRDSSEVAVEPYGYLFQKVVDNGSRTSYLYQNPSKLNETILIKFSEKGTIESLNKVSERI